MDERRQHQRYPVNLPVEILSPSRPPRVGVTRDVSATGVLFHSASRFEPGETLELRIAVARAADRIARGVVVRSFEDPSPDHPLRQVAAVRFAATSTASA